MDTWFWILGWFLSFLTITGNGIIIFLVCSKRQLRTKTNTFVVSLAVADFCVGLNVIPPMFFCEMLTRCNPQSDWMSIFGWIFGFASVTSLCSLVLDRYTAVVKPLKYLTFMNSRRVIQMVSLSRGIPVIFITMVSGLNRFIFKAPILFGIEFWMGVTFLEFLPYCILTFCFISMLQVVWTHDRASRAIAKQLRFKHRVLFKPQEKSALKIMAIVIGLFLLCYGFYIRCSFTLILNEHRACNDKEYKIPLLVLNSAINPAAYAFYKRDIKKEIKRRICCANVGKGNKVEPVNETIVLH